MFVYYWIPGVLFQGLSVFSFVTWIRPNNVVLNQLFGGFTGLSLIPLTFDWVSDVVILFSFTIKYSVSSEPVHVGDVQGIWLSETSPPTVRMRGTRKKGTAHQQPATKRNLTCGKFYNLPNLKFTDCIRHRPMLQHTLVIPYWLRYTLPYLNSSGSLYS